MNEEQKAIKRLEEMKNNYSLNSEDLHYANVLYYLIINLQQENQQLKEMIDKEDGCNHRRKQIFELKDKLAKALKENQQLKLDYELYKDNHTYKNYEVERKDITIKQLQSTLEEIREYMKENRSRYIYQDSLGEDWWFEDLDVYNDLLQIIDKSMEEK